MKNHSVIPAKRGREPGIQVQLGRMFRRWIPAFAGMTSLFALLLFVPLAAHAQSFVNPDTIQQAGDIFLQNTDVYYCPFRPPDSTDSRDSLSDQESILSDPNGNGNPWIYTPISHDTILWSMHPCSSWPDTLGRFVTWQRFFTAKRKADSSASDIVVGSHVTTHHDTGRVTVSKNEDVDFRASGTIKMESGFHVMPGAFFHAYIEPSWGDSVWGDEFDSTALDRNRWFVGNGWLQVLGFPGMECSSDSDARTVTDTDAHDGHALDISLREDTAGCDCHRGAFSPTNNCVGIESSDTATRRFAFTTSALQSCPFPWQYPDSPYVQFYQHAPFGKYEIREKIPHHTNNWGAPSFEWDMGETNAWDSLTTRGIPGFGGIGIQSGPYIGTFGTPHPGDTEVVFRSSNAHFSHVNNPTRIFIDRFPYSVNCQFLPADTFLTPSFVQSLFPSSFANKSFTFYYERAQYAPSYNTTDTLTWHVTTDGGGHWDLLTVPYKIVAIDTSWFTRDYHPTSVTLITDTILHDTVTLNCFWDHGTNKIILDSPYISPSALHSNKQRYQYTVNESSYDPTPPIQFDGNNTVGGYVYHTYTMELLPNELRYLVDGNVVRRWPDRLVPPGNRFYGRVSQIPRGGTNWFPAEFDIDRTTTDTMGTDPTLDTTWWGAIRNKSQTYFERHYLETHLSNPGVWDIEVPPGSRKWYHAAHHLIDYIKTWDVPKDVFIPNFPQ